MYNETPTPPTDSAPLVTLQVVTRHPQDYLLLDQKSGQIWRATSAGQWKAESLPWHPSEGLEVVEAAMHRLLEGFASSAANDRLAGAIRELKSLTTAYVGVAQKSLDPTVSDVTYVRMAKASTQDIDAAYELARLLEDIQRGYLPADGNDESNRTFNEDKFDDLSALHERLQRIAQKGSLFRVVGGLDALLNPRNNIVNPDEDCLALHPLLKAALANATPKDESHEESKESHVASNLIDGLVQTMEYIASFGTGRFVEPGGSQPEQAPAVLSKYAPHPDAWVPYTVEELRAFLQHIAIVSDDAVRRTRDALG